MNKIKYCLIGSIIVVLAIFGGIIFLAKSVKAETSTTFPVDEAGIAAYVKLDSVDNINIADLAEAYSTIEKQGESYVIGRVPVANSPLVYIGLDGWIVAYFLKEEHASRIAGGAKATTLEDAIDYICGRIEVTYSTPVKYYDFEFPEANKITIITEDVAWDNSDSFYVTVPGTLYEGSYRMYVGSTPYGGSTIDLKVDENYVLEEQINTYSGYAPKTLYGYYDPSTYFQTGVTHYVTFGYNFYGSCSSVLIYKN